MGRAGQGKRDRKSPHWVQKKTSMSKDSELEGGQKEKTSAAFYTLNRVEGGEIQEENISWSVKTWRLARGEKGVDSKWSPFHFIIRKDLLGQSND